MTVATKITYTSATGDLEEFHQRFDRALRDVRNEAGQSHPFYIDDQPVQSQAEPLVVRSPVDTSLVLGRFSAAERGHVDAAVQAAKRAQRTWSARTWQERVALLRCAATLIRE